MVLFNDMQINGNYNSLLTNLNVMFFIKYINDFYFLLLANLPLKKHENNQQYHF